jgi:DNA-binding Lrp family transcriptional regulator
MSELRLDRTDRAIVNAFQGGFPVTKAPYEPAAQALQEHGVDVDASELARRIRALDERDILSRFGALINAEALGGAATLVAMSVPEDRFDDVAAIVNDYPKVAHNYEREHDLNMWFVVSVVEQEQIDECLTSIEDETGLTCYNLPKLQEFYLRAEFPVDGPLEDTAIDLSELGPDISAADSTNFQTLRHEMLLEIQDGFPHGRHPYETIAANLDVSVDLLTQVMTEERESGTFRRIGVIPNHYALGYTENAMTVWTVPDPDIEAVGDAVGSLPFVTHCYERPRHADVWPYNFFAMVHGRSKDEANRRIERVREVIDEHSDVVDSDVLRSTRILKKEGLRISERSKARVGSSD